MSSGSVVKQPSGTPRIRHRHGPARVIAVVASAVLVLLIVVGILWATVLPSALSGLSARVAEGESTVTVGDQGAPVTIAVPSGWVTQWPPLQGNTVVLTSPDHVLTISITATGSDATQAFAEASRDAGAVDAPVTETLGSGLSLMHARSGDDALIAAVGVPDGARSAVVVARVAGKELEHYLPAVGQILDGLQVSS
jgi:hypothetical protein